MSGPRRFARAHQALICLGLLLGFTAGASEAHAQSYRLVAGEAAPEMQILGDLLVPKNFGRAIFRDMATWTDGIIPYEYDANVIAANQAAIELAMGEWEAVANLTFSHCAANTCTGNFLHIEEGPESISSVGMKIGGQSLSIKASEWPGHFVMVHILGHALSLDHEPNRADRDDFIKVNFHNLKPNGCGDGVPCDAFYVKLPDAGVSGPYDVDSLLHYHQCLQAASECPCENAADCQTIEVLKDCDLPSSTCVTGALTGESCTSDVHCDPTVGICDTLDTGTCTRGQIGEICTLDSQCDIEGLGRPDHLSQLDAQNMAFLYPGPEIFADDFELGEPGEWHDIVPMPPPAL